MVDCGGLENRCTVRYPGFESLSLRWIKKEGIQIGLQSRSQSTVYQLITVFFSYIPAWK